MAAQFGIKAPEYMGNHAHYIGGWSSVININEVLNTNLDTQESQASIAGKGVSSNQGHTLTYDCGAEHQVIMCVYQADRTEVDIKGLIAKAKEEADAEEKEYDEITINAIDD